MEHLVQDLADALEESKSCGPTGSDGSGRWGMRRRTRSAGNLHLYITKSPDNNSDSSSSPCDDMNVEKHRSTKLACFHQSDSDDLSLSIAVSRALNQKNALRMKHPLGGLIRGVSHSLESDSVNEHSPARPSLRRKRKLKRMCIDETPIPPIGKRKRPQRVDITEGGKNLKHSSKIKPLHPSVVDKIEKFCQPSGVLQENAMETQCTDENYDAVSESSISWSGGEGHEGDDELTDWAPTENISLMDQSPWTDTDPREIRAGCRRIRDERPGFSINTGANERVAKFLRDTTKSELRVFGAEQKKLKYILFILGCRRIRDERPGFSINTGANERVAKFLRDTTKSELRVFGAEQEKLGQLASLYSLDLRFETPSSSLLRKTSRTPSMQPTQRHHSAWNAIHKRIRTHKSGFS